MLAAADSLGKFNSVSPEIRMLAFNSKSEAAKNPQAQLVVNRMDGKAQPQRGATEAGCPSCVFQDFRKSFTSGVLNRARAESQIPF